MAVAVRSVATANTGAAQGTGDVGITVSVPSGTANGDMLYLALMAASSTGVFVTPSGWDAVEAQFSSTGQASAKMVVYRRPALSEPANYTVTWGTSASTGRVAAIMVALTGVNTAVPQQAEAKDAGAGPTSTEVLPSVTPTTATMILGIVGAYTPSFGATTWTADGAMTEITGADTSSSHASASNASIEFATQSVSAGATGTRTATGSRADLRPCGVMVALNPAIPTSRSVVIV